MRIAQRQGCTHKITSAICLMCHRCKPSEFGWNQLDRVLHDSKSILEDQLASITHTTRKRGGEGVFIVTD